MDICDDCPDCDDGDVITLSPSVGASGVALPAGTLAILALPTASGTIYDGKQQFFTKFSPQPPSTTPSGLAALAAYDLPANGGNGDGVIDARDAIYPYLRVWIDVNRDGAAQPQELHTLSSLGVASISLNRSLAQRFGTRFLVLYSTSGKHTVSPRGNGGGRLALDR